MATTQLSGLVSGFDWKAFIDSTIEYSSAPITRLEKEQSTNRAKSTALGTLDGKMSVLQTAVASLGQSATFLARKISGAALPSSWSAAAESGAAIGAYKLDVTQIATASRLRGSTDIGSGLSATDDVSGLTLSTLSLGNAVTTGTFTVNGQRVTVDLADSLEDVFAAISTATGGAVTAAYSAATDKVTLSGSGPIVLGAANDTSNFLSAFRLANNGSASVSSSSALGALQLGAPLDSAGLRGAFTSGSGTFSINGVDIAYDTGADSLKTLLTRINASAAGVSASYDTASDRISLVNKTTGDTGISLVDSAGGILGALGLSTGTLERGDNAVFTINDGPELISASNTLASSAHGIEGLRVTVGATGSDTLTVSGDTEAMKSRVTAFINAYNDVQRFIEDQSKVTSANGKVTTSTLSNEREVASWAQTLRRDAFASVSGLSGTLTRLEGLGLDFLSGTSELTIKSSTKFEEALANRTDDVAAFFGSASSGFVGRFKTSLDLIAGGDFNKGYIETRQTALATNNTDIDKQIEVIERQLEQQRELLTSSFIAMENAQQSYNNMQTQLTKSFFSSSNSS